MRLNAIASLVIVSGLLLAGCSSTSTNSAAPMTAQDTSGQSMSGDKVTITKATWAAFINYKQWLMPKSYSTPVGDGYFAVTKDGRGWGITGCPDTACDVGTLDSGVAIEECQKRNGGTPCLIFAHKDQIVVPYEVSQ